MTCPQCAFENPPAMAFCGRCGTKWASLCPACGFVIREGFAFCGKCGARVAQAPAPALQGSPAVYDFARDLRERGPAAEVDFHERFKSHPLGNLHTFAGFDQVREWEEEYLPAEELGKYADSVGHQPGKP